MDEADFFDEEYADELAAMADMDDDFLHCPPKRLLDFTTPSNKGSKGLNDSVMEPLSDSDGPEATTVSTNDENANLSQKPGLSQQSMLSQNQKRKSIEMADSGTGKSAKRYKPDIIMEEDSERGPSPPPAPILRPSLLARGPMEATERIMENYDYERPRVLRRIPASDFVSVTTEDGRRYYMARQTDAQRLSKSSTLSNHSSLLSTSYQELKQKVLDNKLAELQKATEQHIQELDTEMDEVDSLSEIMSGLWVDRYAPRGYTDLLSDEGTNRTLLHWLKLWDHVVFGREVKKRNPVKETKSDKFQKKDFRKEQLEMEMELDSLHRPFHKIVLLCGPPGLGKTTLAHVLAKHAGYRVTEINASDDRSAEVFKNKVQATIQMRAVIGDDHRPNCLIIDEIDGAPLPAINHLIGVVKGGVDGDGGGDKKKKSPLMRPIICICNDQYTPALRQLRLNALILNFPPTMPIKLAGRLIDICHREGLKADQSTLLALCSKTDNDIRSCINTLQFFRSKKADLMLRDIQNSTFAQKDVSKGLFTVWQSIFQRPKQNKRQYVNPYDRTPSNIKEITNLQNEQNNTLTASRFYQMYGLATTTGEYEKVVMGMYDNYLNQNIKDPRLQGIGLASTWLCHYDMMNARTGRTQDYSTYAYMPYVTVLFHLLFASNQVNKLQFPHSDSDYRQKLATSRGLVTSLMDQMSTSIRHYLDVKSAVLYVLPPLMDIIQPSFRPINTQLYSAREKADLKHLIRVMIEYNLNYTQDKTQDGHYTYLLEPQVDQLIKFPGMKQHKQMTYAAKQLVSREIDLEKMRRADGPVPSSSNAKKETKPKAKTEQEIPNHQKVLKAKQVDEKDLIMRDFFGRKIDEAGQQNVVKQANPKKKAKTTDDGSGLLSRDVWYHFKEGYSNAVRKTIRIQDMI